MTAVLKKATASDAPLIWAILQDAIAQRKREGSAQWQNGYPNEQTVHDDIAAQGAYLLFEDDIPVAYAAILFGHEPAYDDIEGEWLTDGRYAVVHRLARSGTSTSKGVAAKLLALAETLCASNGIGSIRLDTNFDNAAMLKVLDSLGYHYCGEIMYQGAPRRAYEKIIAGHVSALDSRK